MWVSAQLLVFVVRQVRRFSGTFRDTIWFVHVERERVRLDGEFVNTPGVPIY